MAMARQAVCRRFQKEFCRDTQRRKAREVGATQRENMDPAPYEVEFMNVVVDKQNDLQVTDADSHLQFAGVHPSKMKQGKLFLYDKLKPADRERVMQNICKKGAQFTYMTMDLLTKRARRSLSIVWVRITRTPPCAA